VLAVATATLHACIYMLLQRQLAVVVVNPCSAGGWPGDMGYKNVQQPKLAFVVHRHMLEPDLEPSCWLATLSRHMMDHPPKLSGWRWPHTAKKPPHSAPPLRQRNVYGRGRCIAPRQVCSALVLGCTASVCASATGLTGVHSTTGRLANKDCHKGLCG
jgi:hypothetical protein